MTATMTRNDTTVSRQWSSRPDDQRFLTLEDLKASVLKRRNESWTHSTECSKVRVLPTDMDDPKADLVVEVYNPGIRQTAHLTPTNWSFGQLARYAGAPSDYMRKLPAQLAAINLQYGLEHGAAREQALILAQSNGHNELRAVTSPSYGRIYDIDVVRGVEMASQNGNWKVPAASYATTNPKRATTLYASDRDVFIFLVDPDNAIEVGGERMFRGFYTWNSEVGSQAFGLATFLYRYVCDNRIIWGQTQFNELRIRHTSGAPERFAHEGAKALQAYSDQGVAETANAIKAAQQTAIPLKKDQTIEEWIKSRFGSTLTKEAVTGAVQSAKAEEGEARSFWQIVNGITAYARADAHTDDRIKLERAAGVLLTEAASYRTPDLTLPTRA